MLTQEEIRERAKEFHEEFKRSKIKNRLDYISLVAPTQEAKNKLKREWKKRNPDKVREYQKKYLSSDEVKKRQNELRRKRYAIKKGVPARAHEGRATATNN
jgi:hypothetical protein